MNTSPMFAAVRLAALALAAHLVAADAGAATQPDKKRKAAPPDDSRTVVVDGVKYTVPAAPSEGSANALLLKRFDLNGDGKIDEAEIAAAQTAAGANRSPSFNKIADDRRLTAKDLFEGGDPAKRRASAKIGSDDLLKQYDANNDGKLDAAEFERLKRDIVKGSSRPELRPDTPPAPPARPLPVVKEPLR